MGFTVSFNNEDEDFKKYDLKFILANPGLYRSANNPEFKFLTVEKNLCLFLDTKDNVIEKLDTPSWKDTGFFIETESVSMEIRND